MKKYRILPFLIIAGIIAGLLLLLNFLFPGALNAEGSKLQLISLVLILSYLVLGIGAKQFKKKNVLDAVFGWSVIFIILLLGYSYQDDLKDIYLRVKGELIPSKAQTIDEQTVKLKTSQNGHFITKARVNGDAILFLVDTGASRVTLTQKDAKRIGIDIENLNYNSPTSTANGMSWSALITLDYIEIGSIRINNVKASVAKGGLDKSLLGNTFLSRLKGYSVEKDILILKK